MSKNKIVLFHFITILSLYSSSVLAVDRNVYFIGAAFGATFTNVQDVSDEGTTTEISLGQYYNNIDVSFEVAYADLGDYDLTKPISNGQETINYDVSGVKFFAAKHLRFSNSMYASIRGGGIYWREETETTTFDQSGTITSNVNDKDSGVSIYLGLGYGFSITPETRLNIIVEAFKTGDIDFGNAMLGIIFSI